MSPRQRTQDPREIDALIGRGRFAEAAARCKQWTRLEPKNPYAWSGLGRANFALGFYGEASNAATRLLALVPSDARTECMLAISEHKIGRTQSAIDRLRRLSGLANALADEAAYALAEVLEQAGRFDELQAHIERGGPWLESNRAVTFEAWLLAKRDRSAAIELLCKVARTGHSPSLRREAGFAAVQMLDADGRYQEAFAVARATHADSSGTFDLKAWEAHITAQHRALDALRPLRREASARPFESGSGRSVAFMLSLPRSGTTLLEQMLDRHPLLSGIGEFEGVARLPAEVDALGIGLDSLSKLFPADATRIRNEYLAEAISRARPDTKWLLDKSLRPLMSIPWLAVVLPNARYIQLERDPRDRAISLYLSNFHPVNWALTSSLDALCRLTQLVSDLVPHAVEALDLPVLRVQYEELVDRPEAKVREVLEHLGLPFDASVLEPERNQRPVLTLSAQQVRRKINRSSIGRWKNYAAEFGPAWDAAFPA